MSAEDEALKNIMDLSGYEAIIEAMIKQVAECSLLLENARAMVDKIKRETGENNGE